MQNVVYEAAVRPTNGPDILKLPRNFEIKDFKS